MFRIMKNFRATPLLVSLIVLSCFCSAQDINIGIGDVKDIKRNGQALDISTTSSFVQVEIISPSIVHVRADKRKLVANFSYAVVGVQVESNFKFDDGKNEIVITTDSLKIVIHKKPFRIAYYSPDEKLVNEDEAAFGIQWTGHEVTNYKKI